MIMNPLTAESQRVYRIVPGVYYRQVTDWVYLRNVNTRMDYRLNRGAYAILNAFRSPSSMATVASCLKERFDVSDEELMGLLAGFVDRLCGMGVLECIDDAAVVGKVDIPSQIQMDCGKTDRLWSACLEITYRCNEKCRHCYLDRGDEVHQDGELELDEYRRLVGELRELGAMSVLITGGEPTVRKDFLDICKLVSSSGMLLNVYTNALSLDESYLDVFRDLHVNSVSCSLYGGGAFHDWVTRVPGSYERSFGNLLKLKAAGLDVYVKTVLFHGQLDEYRKLVSRCAHYGIKVVATPFLIQGHSGESKASLSVDENELGEYYKMEGANASLGLDGEQGQGVQRSGDEYVCAAGHTTLSVNPYGDVFACNACPEPVGNIRTLSLANIWRGSEELARLRSYRLRDVTPHCASCPDSGNCMTCVGAMLRENGGRLAPCSTTCRNARIYSKMTSDKNR